MHPRTYVAQTTCAHVNHFYRSVLEAMEFDGPAVLCCYTTCQPEHGVADNMATDQARLAVDTRAFPMMIYDPRKGDTIRERLSLQGNPAVNEDWWFNPKTGEQVDFVEFCRSEGRFGKHFDRDGNPSEMLMEAQQERLENWKQLQELAGVLDKKKSVSKDKPHPAAATKTSPVAENGLPGGLTQGTRIKYTVGGNSVTGVVASSNPVVLSLDDNTEIPISANVLGQALEQGIVAKL